MPPARSRGDDVVALQHQAPRRNHARRDASGAPLGRPNLSTARQPCNPRRLRPPRARGTTTSRTFCSRTSGRRTAQSLGRSRNCSHSSTSEPATTRNSRVTATRWSHPRLGSTSWRCSATACAPDCDREGGVHQEGHVRHLRPARQFDGFMAEKDLREWTALLRQFEFYSMIDFIQFSGITNHQLLLKLIPRTALSKCLTSSTVTLQTASNPFAEKTPIVTESHPQLNAQFVSAVIAFSRTDRVPALAVQRFDGSQATLISADSSAPSSLRRSLPK